MAGGKETPRQKMIGMMYLVLTALLALQVSNAVLENLYLLMRPWNVWRLIMRPEMVRQSPT